MDEETLSLMILFHLDETGLRLLTVRGSTMEWISPVSQTFGQVNLGSNMRYISAFDVDNRTNTYFWSDLATNTIYSRSERATNYTKVTTFDCSKRLNAIFSLPR